MSEAYCYLMLSVIFPLNLLNWETIHNTFVVSHWKMLYDVSMKFFSMIVYI